MERIDLKTGFFCNNDCKMCVQAHKKQFGNKSTEQLKQYLREAVVKYKGVVFTGGEATIREDILDLVSYAKKIGYSLIQIQTNGRMFAYSDFCLRMIDAGASEFALAIHGQIAKLHDYLTSSIDSFGQTLQGIKNLLSLNQRVLTNTVITKPNYRHLPEIAKLLAGLGVKQFQFAFVHILGNATKNIDSIVPRKSLIEPYVKKALDIGISSKAKPMTEGIPYCFMQGYEKFISERTIPRTKVYDLDYIIEDFTEVRQKEGKIKGSVCKGCHYYKICEGPWKEYPQKYGWEEFNPVL